MKTLVVRIIPIIILVAVTVLLSCRSMFSFSSFEKPVTLWQYQCIDTMKLSRDGARSMLTKPDYQATIKKTVDTIAGMGANCIALGTPYDEEFVPFLTLWVQDARQAHLHVWFRGNFSAREGWFSYPKTMTAQAQLDATQHFITSHPDLFRDGDIFTPAPEAENTWSAKGTAQPSEYPAFRQYLITEKTVAGAAFSRIGKNVETDWLSMSGGVAKGVLDQSTIDKIGGIVTLDHYVKDPGAMDEYINFFHDTYHATLVLGEFGAPIPDINGDMSEDEQAAFVDALLRRLYAHAADIKAVNYWVLSDSSTALLNTDGTPRKVVDVLKKYYIPAIISGTVVDDAGDPVQHVVLSANDGMTKTSTDKNGYYRIVVPAENTTIQFSHADYATANTTIAITKGGEWKQNISLKPANADIIYTIKLLFKNLWLKIFGVSKN